MARDASASHGRRCASVVARGIGSEPLRRNTARSEFRPLCFGGYTGSSVSDTSNAMASPMTSSGSLKAFRRSSGSWQSSDHGSAPSSASKHVMQWQDSRDKFGSRVEAHTANAATRTTSCDDGQMGPCIGTATLARDCSAVGNAPRSGSRLGPLRTSHAATLSDQRLGVWRSLAARLTGGQEVSRVQIPPPRQDVT